MSQNLSNDKRKDSAPPAAIGKLGWQYHHIGIPTIFSRLGERYVEHLKVHAEGFDRSPYGIEWMRFEPGGPIPELVRTVPHIAFEVDDLDAAIEGKTLIGEVSS